MDLTRLEAPATERQLLFDLSHLSVNQSLTRPGDFLMKAQHDFEVNAAREKHLHVWSEKLKLETTSRFANQFLLNLPLSQLMSEQ
jgi:hypothetical protein